MKKFLFIILTILLLMMSMFWVGCDNADNEPINDPVIPPKTITYYWVDADGTLIHEETVDEGISPTEHPLPNDNDKWDYIEWKLSDESNKKVAYRVPKTSYFTGNVFQIIAQDLGEQPISVGSGFVFNSEGWFITNAHVIENAYYAQAIFNIPNSDTGESFTYFDINNGTYYHLNKDIYIGKIDNYSAIKTYYKEIPIDLTYEVGEKTYSVGYPNSSTELELHDGNVTESWSDLYEKLYSGNSYICSSSYIAPGSSGGILTNQNLEVIGITTLGWNDDNNKFISGAAISAFNFNNLLKNTNNNELISLQERFHENENVYISYFNQSKVDEANGLCKKTYFDDGTVGYVYERQEEGVNSEDLDYSFTGSLLVGSDGLMILDEEYYWSNGERRTILFYGYFDHEKGFDNFIYEFKYEWKDSSYYTVECSDINFSPTISLTLNRCTVKGYSCTPTDKNIEYAKEQFNYIYSMLVEDMARLV